MLYANLKLVTELNTAFWTILCLAQNPLFPLNIIIEALTTRFDQAVNLDLMCEASAHLGLPIGLLLF